MVQTPERLIALLQNLGWRNYLKVKFALMPAGEWFTVLRTLPDAEELVARVCLLPDAVLEYLSVSPNPEVRGAVAHRVQCPASVQFRLVEDPEPAVRRRLANGRGTLRAILERLAGDGDAATAYGATWRLAVGRGRLDDRFHRCRSRKHWGAARYPVWLEQVHDREGWKVALREEAEQG